MISDGFSLAGDVHRRRGVVDEARAHCFVKTGGEIFAVDDAWIIQQFAGVLIRSKTPIARPQDMKEAGFLGNSR